MRARLPARGNVTHRATNDGRVPPKRKGPPHRRFTGRTGRNDHSSDRSILQSSVGDELVAKDWLSERIRSTPRIAPPRRVIIIYIISGCSQGLSPPQAV